MTTLITQVSSSDCALASMAMAAGHTHLFQVWTQEDVDTLVKNRGMSDEEPYMKRLGWNRRIHYRTVYTYGERMDNYKTMLWLRPALLSVHSLNIDGSNHMVYWDGEKVWDPSPKRTYEFLHSMIIDKIIVLNPSIVGVPQC